MATGAVERRGNLIKERKEMLFWGEVLSKMANGTAITPCNSATARTPGGQWIMLRKLDELLKK